MIGYLGVPGALVALPYRGGLSTSTDRPVSFARTMGGKRKAFMGARGRREWDVSFDLMGSREVAGLVEVARSAGEVMWYPADATAGNLFSPQAASFDVLPSNAVHAGMVALPDGSVARTVASSAGVVPGDAHGGSEHVPVRPGQQITVGAWGLGGLRLMGWWRDSQGAATTSWAGPISAFTGWGWREHTLTPPAGTAFLSLSLSNASQYARPSVAWGPVGQNKPGRGCPKAVVHGLSEALTVINADDAYGSIDVTITEVG